MRHRSRRCRRRCASAPTSWSSPFSSRTPDAGTASALVPPRRAFQAADLVQHRLQPGVVRRAEDLVALLLQRPDARLDLGALLARRVMVMVNVRVDAERLAQ